MLENQNRVCLQIAIDNVLNLISFVRHQQQVVLLPPMAFDSIRDFLEVIHWNLRI